MDYGILATWTIFGLLILMMFQERIGPDSVMFAGLCIYVAIGVIDIRDALSGFANPSLAMIGAMYVIGAGLQGTGAMDTISALLLGRPKAGTPLLRLLIPVASLSAFMNNTPIVAFFLPVFVQYAKQVRLSPSRLLIPLSYATILGGCCTMIGTSTNLVVDSIMRQKGLEPMEMFELTWVGLPVTIIGLIYLQTFGRRLLPDRQDLLEHIESHRREYIVEMVVQAGCPLIDRTVRQSGLRDLPGLYLFRIERGRAAISPVSPSDTILQNDLLSFSGIASTVVDLQKIRNLVPAEHAGMATNLEGFLSLDSLEGLSEVVAPTPRPRTGRQLSEVVISTTSPLLGLSIREADFRARYGGSILAVHRSGEKLEQKIGKIVLHVGDTLLIDCDDDFSRRWRHSPDFVLVSGVEDSAPVVHERAWISISIFVAVVFGISLPSIFPVLDQYPIFEPTALSLVGAVLTVVTGCVRGVEGHRSIQMSVILLVGASLGVSTALQKSGAADQLASLVEANCQNWNPVLLLAVIYLLSMLLSEFLSNTACAAIMGSLSVTIATGLDLDPRPFVIAVAIASSCAFATPIGYQTNLMVLNPGGYKFSDYLKVGLPLNGLAFVVSMIVIPLFWKF